MYIGIDAGGTHIRIGAVESLTSPNLKHFSILPSANDYDADKRLMIDTIHTIVGTNPVEGIGIGLAGPLSDDRSHLLPHTPNLSAWVNKPLKDDLMKEFHTTVRLENDAVVAGLSEATYGDGKGKDFFFVIWGTGVGGTEVHWHGEGKDVYPLEIGHQILDWNSTRVCNCGQMGCAEAYLGGSEVRKYYGKAPENLNETEWSLVESDMAHMLLNLITIQHPDQIIIGGGIAVRQAHRIPKIVEIVSKHLLIYPIPPITVSRLGDVVGFYGALALLA
jgi:predicted NBD/HSP70 family sugar kinase